MDKAILYIHGKGGNPKEAEYYKAVVRQIKRCSIRQIISS